MLFKKFELNLTVDGMHCMKCVARITEALKKIGSVKKVNIDLDKKSVKVISSSQLDQSTVENVIESLGFKVIK
jgi:copper chaperone CopZ